MEDVVLRGYRRGDLDALFRLDEVCFAKPFRFSKSDLRRFAEDRNAQVLIAEAARELAGFSIAHVERTRGEFVAYLLTLDVVPAFRRRGIAWLLLDRAEEDARGTGCGAMLLHVHTGNDAAIGLYEKRGYIRFGAAENFYGEGLHAWVYRKPLA